MEKKSTTDVVRIWGQTRTVLEGLGYVEELEKVVNELWVLKYAVEALEVDDEYSRDGIASLMGTLTDKLLDLAQGRRPMYCLPT